MKNHFSVLDFIITQILQILHRKKTALPDFFLTERFSCFLYLDLFLCDISFCLECLCTKYSSAGSSSYGVVGKSYEFVIVNFVLTETSDRYAHSIFVIDILAYLRTVVFFEVLDEVLRCARKFQFLWKSLEVSQGFDQLLFGRFLAK